MTIAHDIVTAVGPRPEYTGDEEADYTAFREREHMVELIDKLCQYRHTDWDTLSGGQVTVFTFVDGSIIARSGSDWQDYDTDADCCVTRILTNKDKKGCVR